MAATREDLPENIDALKAVLLVERARAVRVEPRPRHLTMTP